MLPLLILLFARYREYVRLDKALLDWRWHTPLFERHNLQHDIFGELQILLTVGAKFELFNQALDVQISKTSLEEPLIK